MLAAIKNRDKEELVAFDIDVGLYMAYYYAALYVVVEGWKKTGFLSDPKIDALIDSPNTGLLKHYRHGVFHFKGDYFQKDFIDLYGSKGIVKWIHNV